MLLNGIYHDPSLFPEVFRLFKEQYPDHHLSLRFPNQIDTFSKVVIRVCMNDELFQKYILDPDRHQQSPVLKRFVNPPNVGYVNHTPYVENSLHVQPCFIPILIDPYQESK